MKESTLSGQLEEGEIVDDDFEDISDNSIIEPTFGKLSSSYENLRALSLSSDSDFDAIRQTKSKRKLLQRKIKIKKTRRRKKRQLSSDSSDSDISAPRDLKGKLKEAIHISGIEGSHKNTLETRLRAMGGLPANTEPPTEVIEPSETNRKESDNSEKNDDVELENLRLEALKTAILNKCQRRKRKKTQVDGEDKPLEKHENKENDTPKDEQNDKKVEANPIFELEEDEDVLRASLLAGLAKKIAKKTPKEIIIEMKPIPPKLPIQITPALPKRRPINNFKSNNILNKQVINKKIVNKQVIQKINRPKPQVKPLIININDDSDSDEETQIKFKDNSMQKVPQIPLVKPKQLPNAIPKVQDLTAIASNVEKFLKEQRAKFETEHRKKPPIDNKKDKTILEKSAVKLLPKSQQIEYQQLLKRLRNAEKRRRAKKLALQKNEAQTVPEPPKTNQVTVEVCTKEPTLQLAAAVVENATPPKIEVVVKTGAALEVNSPPVEPNTEKIERKVSYEEASKSDSSYGGTENKSSRDSDTSERKPRITTELTTLQRTLKEIKMQRSGSLQIKTKYQVLTPIIRKITATSNERKKQERRIKTLLQELNEARKYLTKSHEKFSSLVRELVSTKEKIDKSMEEANEKVTQNRNIVDIGKRETKSVPVTSTPIKTQSDDVTDEATISTFITSSTNNDCEDMDVCNSDETDICQIDIVDPNDIDQIFRRRAPIKSTVPEYVSPLNFNIDERYRHVDPLGIMCPYEVNGSCRDVDCTYKHYLKNHERL